MLENNILFLILLLLIKEENSKVNLTFNIRNEKNEPINEAYIIIKSLNEHFCIKGKTNKIGNAFAIGLFKNIYNIHVYKEGYINKNFTVDLCKTCKFNITLCHKVPNRLYGFITDECDKKVNNALVVLYKVLRKDKYMPIRFTYTDFTGEYNFIDIPKACYIVKAIK